MNNFFLCLVVVLCVPFIQPVFSASGEGSEAQSWSFSKHPMPTFEEMAPEQRSKVLLMGETHERFCTGWVIGHYTVYQDLYPAYSAFAADEVARQRWRRSVLEDREEDIYNCFAEVIVRELIDAAEEVSTGKVKLVCNFELPHELKDNPSARIAMEDLIHFTKHRNRLVVWLLATQHSRKEKVSFGPDITYYLRLIAKGTTPFFPGSEIFSDRRDELSPERRQFIEAAAARGDLEAVIRSSPPCGDD